MAFRNFDGNDNWEWQLRGNDGRWINMYGSVVFDYTPKGGGPSKKGHGTFQGVASPGRANIFVKDDPELEVGLYEVQSQYITGVKAIIPGSNNKPESTPAVEEPSTPELKDEITGDEAMQVVRNAGARYAKSQGRFAMSRTYEDIRQGLRAQYMQFLDGIKKDNPELLKNQFIVNEDGTGRFGDIETEDDFWGAITAMQVGTGTRWIPVKDINPLAQEVNRRYAEKFLGIKKDGLISFYRNVLQEKDTPGDAAAGYASLDKKMAWDYNPSPRPGDVTRGRYIVKAKPDEVHGILGFSGALDEFGVVISPEITNLPGRSERVGDMEKQRIDGAPWVDYEELDKESRFGGGSPFRFLSPMTNFDYYALDSSPFGEGDGWASFYEANGLQQGAMPNKYNELYGEGAWEKDWGSSNPTARQFASLFIKFTDKDGKEKWGLDAPKLRELSRTDMLNNAKAGDEFDRNIKVLSSMQELMGKPFFVNKGHDQSDPRIPKPVDAEGSAPIARIPETARQSKPATEEQLSDLAEYFDRATPEQQLKIQKALGRGDMSDEEAAAILRELILKSAPRSQESNNELTSEEWLSQAKNNYDSNRELINRDSNTPTDFVPSDTLFDGFDGTFTEYVPNDPNNPSAGGTIKRTPSSGNKLINYNGRITTLVNINGRMVPFYLSSGAGDKKDVEAGKWYPFFGIGSDQDWYNKANAKYINNYYGSPELRAQSEWLNANIGDVRSDKSIPGVGKDQQDAFREKINADLHPVNNKATGEDGAEDVDVLMKANIADVVSSVQSKKERNPAQLTPDAEGLPDAPKGREVSSRTMQKEFDVNSQKSNELKDKIAKELLKRIFAKGITKNDLSEMLDIIGKTSIWGVENTDYKNIRFPRWEGVKPINEVMVTMVSTFKRLKNNSTIEEETVVFYRPLTNAISTMIARHKLDPHAYIKDYEKGKVPSLTYEDAIALIEKLNSTSATLYKQIDNKSPGDSFEIGHSENAEKLEDAIAYQTIKKMVSMWATTSNDSSPFSLAKQELTAKVFNIENYLPWTPEDTPELVNKNKEIIMKEGEKVLTAFIESQYEATQEELKAKGISSVELHRGMADTALRAALDEYGSLPDNLVILRPLSSFSYDLSIAVGFGGEQLDPNWTVTYEQWAQNPDRFPDIVELKPNQYFTLDGEIKEQNGVVLTTTVPVDRIFSMPFSGVGCLSEAEVVVLGPNLRAEILTQDEGRDIALYYESAGDEED